jgi:hypothetical protein
LAGRPFKRNRTCPALVTPRHQGGADNTVTAAGGGGTAKNAKIVPAAEMTVAKTRATRTPRKNWGSALREDINSLLLAPEPPLLLTKKPCRRHGLGKPHSPLNHFWPARSTVSILYPPPVFSLDPYQIRSEITSPATAAQRDPVIVVIGGGAPEHGLGAPHTICQLILGNVRRPCDELAVWEPAVIMATPSLVIGTAPDSPPGAMPQQGRLAPRPGALFSL